MPTHPHTRALSSQALDFVLSLSTPVLYLCGGVIDCAKLSQINWNDEMGLYCVLATLSSHAFTVYRKTCIRFSILYIQIMFLFYKCMSQQHSFWICALVHSSTIASRGILVLAWITEQSQPSCIVSYCKGTIVFYVIILQNVNEKRKVYAQQD